MCLKNCVVVDQLSDGWPAQLVQHTTRIGCPGRDPSSKMTYLKQDDEKLVLMLDRNLSRA